MTQAAKTLPVVVGIVRRPDGAVLMGTRPMGKPFEGYWEFPGGKIESGETAADALRRELIEEIGIDVVRQEFAWIIEHRYPHAHVALTFHWVTDWAGSPRALEGQQVLWITPGQAWPYPILPATVPLLGRIRNYKA